MHNLKIEYVYEIRAQWDREYLTEGIKGPYAFGEALLLPKGALIQPIVYETVHEGSCCSSIDWRHK